MNGPCKKWLKNNYLRWQLREIERRHAAGEKDKLVIKISREQLMTWAEEFVKEFNFKEKSGITDVLVPCLTKLGQNIFSEETEPFIRWLDSLKENALYKALHNAHTAMDL